jgi:hypothetical protein
MHQERAQALVNRRTPTILAATILGAVLMTSTTASAYCHKSTCDPKKESCETDEYDCVSSGRGVAWTTSPIPYRFHAAGSALFDDRSLRATVRRAFQAWENVECSSGQTSLRFGEGEDIETDPPAGEAAPLDYGIYFRDDVWPEGKLDLALSRVDLYRSGRIYGANIEVNTADKRFRLSSDDEGDYDLEAVLIHEVGHYLGLDHSGEPGSIMARSYCDGREPCPLGTEELRTLGTDDIAAVCRLYPPAQTGLDQTGGCRSVPGQAPAWPWLVLPLVGAIRRARLVRRKRTTHF